ncbi:MAG: AAA family ATPase [Sedimenticola sp.]
MTVSQLDFTDFGFEANPFAITPDPRYLFLSAAHEEGLAHLLYGTGPNGGFVQLTGEVGIGKTLLIRTLLDQRMVGVNTAYIYNPRISRREFLAAICDELSISYDQPIRSSKQLIDRLVHHLLRSHGKGERTVLIVDEAQNLRPTVLETVRLLTNLETSRHKLLRIILVGQPELNQLLMRKELRQVAQRITARYHLMPLGRHETAAYIRHRMRTAGMTEGVFKPSSLWLVHHLTHGVPRLINALCERALLGLFVTGEQRIGMKLMWKAAREVNYPVTFPGKLLMRGVFASLLIAAATALGLSALSNSVHIKRPLETTASLTLMELPVNKIVTERTGHFDQPENKIINAVENSLSAG